MIFQHIQRSGGVGAMGGMAANLANGATGVAVLPRRIDSARPYPEGVDIRAGARHGDYLGGLAWTAEATAYYGPMVPRSVAYRRSLRTEWWREPGLYQAIAAHVGAEVAQALVAWLRDSGGQDYHRHNRSFAAGRRNPGWLDVQRRRANAHARALLGRGAIPVAPRPSP